MAFEYQKIETITPDLHGLFLIDHDTYHAGIGYSSTTVKKALGSYDAFNLPYQDSQAFSFGRAFHTALLEPNEFELRYAMSPRSSLNKNTNVYKDLITQFKTAAGDREIITPEDFDLIEAMRENVLKHPDYQAKTFEAEVMAITTCKETGLLLKCKSDLFGHKIIDIKTTSNGVAPAEFMNDIIKWNYHVSAAFYQDIITAVLGVRPDFELIPVSKKPPHDCEIYKLSDDLLEEGRKLYKLGLQRIAKWNKMPEEKRAASGKKARVLSANSRMIYTTKETIEYLG